MKNSKVLVIGQIPPPVHGASMMNLYLLQSLSEVGIKVDFLDKNLSKTVNQIGKLSIAKLVRALKLVSKTAKNLIFGKSDVVILFFSASKSSLAVDFLLSKIVNFSGAKLVLYIHTIGFTEISKNSRLNRRFIEGIFSSSVKIVTLGETMKNDLTLFNMLSKTVVIKNTSRHNFNSSLKNGLSHQKLEAPDVLFLSNLLPKKGILDFLQVASITLKSLPDLKFSVIGSTSSPKFMSYIEEELVRLDLVDKIKFIGEQSGDEKWHLLEEAQVLLFPSHYQEAQPLTIIEAMSVSTPTIAYDNGGIKDLVLNGINGVLVPSNDVEVMSRELIELMSDPNKLFFLSSNSRKFYETHHACLHYSNAWKSLLENLSAGPSPDTI